MKVTNYMHTENNYVFHLSSYRCRDRFNTNRINIPYRQKRWLSTYEKFLDCMMSFWFCYKCKRISNKINRRSGYYSLTCSINHERKSSATTITTTMLKWKRYCSAIKDLSEMVLRPKLVCRIRTRCVTPLYFVKMLWTGFL